ncbi:hypothetical protein DFP72DRAFT_845245 [Ephemerocybe angulata]|uniref:Uncharacterized protein n=1 Tax=Ephemerocybe angulata TaxID=980116 RepID=A0A8H6M750_9AGAR|nr:hypothetical protein DFP72DRAFT_845245 [Tulosesus angulatus]
MTGRTAESEKTSFVRSEAGVAMGSLVQGRNCQCQVCVMVKRSEWKSELDSLPSGEGWSQRPGKLREVRTRWGTIREGSEVQRCSLDIAASPPSTSLFHSPTHHISTPIQPTHPAKANDGGKHTEPHIHARTILPHTHLSFQARNPHLTHPLRHAKPSYSAPRLSEAPTIQRNNAYALLQGLWERDRWSLQPIWVKKRERSSIMRPMFVEVLRKAQTRFVCIPGSDSFGMCQNIRAPKGLAGSSDTRRAEIDI